MKAFFCKCTLVSVMLLSLSGCCLETRRHVYREKKSQDVKQEPEASLADARLAGQKRKKKYKYSWRRKHLDREKISFKPYFKPYEDHVSEQDRRDISFVVSSAAEKSPLSLAMSQQEIKKALQRLSTVHPLALLQAVSEDPSLLLGLKKMQERDWVWDLFMTELNRSFSEAASQGVIKESDVSTFSTNLGLDKETVSSFVREERWHQLLAILIS